MNSKVCALVLAAGEGIRYQQLAGAGQSKLLAPCMGRDGVERPVLEHVLAGLQGLVDKCLLITRPELTEVIALGARFGCQQVLLDSAGMGDSIAIAVAAAPTATGWLVVLGDMPFILTSTVSQIIDALEDDAISVPVYGVQFGHPVAFGRSFGRRLVGLGGEKGARRLFKTGRVREVEVDDPGVLWDVDVPSALVFAP